MVDFGDSRIPLCEMRTGAAIVHGIDHVVIDTPSGGEVITRIQNGPKLRITGVRFLGISTSADHEGLPVPGSAAFTASSHSNVMFTGPDFPTHGVLSSTKLGPTAPYFHILSITPWLRPSSIVVFDE